jgi:hypothetical protein
MTPEEYQRLHKEAFRTAFDFLNMHFPPEQDPEWWLQAAKDLSETSVLHGENDLVVGLLSAVYDYLEEERKRRANGTGV